MIIHCCDDLILASGPESLPTVGLLSQFILKAAVVALLVLRSEGPESVILLYIRGHWFQPSV